MARQDVLVQVRDAGGSLIGEIDNYASLTATVHHNDVGEWQLDVPADSRPAGLLALAENVGGGIVVSVGGRTFLSGPVLSHSWQVTDGDRGPVLSVSGSDDMVVLTHRLVWPDPANDIAAQTTDYFTTGTGDAESVLRALVDVSLGASALPERRLPGLTQTTATGAGRNLAPVQLRFDVLLEALQTIAQLAATDADIGDGGVVSGGDPRQELGFRVEQSGAGPVFTAYALRVLPHAKFSFDLGNLVAAEHNTRTPTATYAIVGTGSVDDGSGRQVAQRLYGWSQPDTSYPSRIETYVDAGSLDEGVDGAAPIEQVGLKALADGAGQVSAQVTPRDTPYLVYGSDYRVGDFVTVDLPGLSFQAPIRSATLTVEGGDRKFALGIGTSEGAFSAKTSGQAAQVLRLRTALRRRTVAR